MSDLTRIEKRRLEKFFGMEGGYVMDFSNRTFSEFIYESLRIEIYDDKYDYGSGSKANRLRGFWQVENNYNVGKLTRAILDFWKEERTLNLQQITPQENALYEECMKTALRLLQDTIVEEIDVINDQTEDRDFNLLAKSIKEKIEKNEPEAALDRLHTYVMKFIRQLCKKHNVDIKKEESLNAIFGKYVKFILSNNKIESKMSEKILKCSISILDAFNDIRNNRSFAHDNPILNYNESILIFNNVTNSIKFIESIEDQIDKEITEKKQKSDQEKMPWDELPF